MAKARAHLRNAEPAGLWHQPALLNLLADALLVLGSVGLAWAALSTLQRLPFFPLREVVLAEMPQRVSAEQIAHATRMTVGGNFFTVDLDATQAAVEKLPWVRNVAVRRLWPDSLYLTLEEHVAVAHWRHQNGEMALLNQQGEVFIAELPDNAPGLPQLSGPDGTAAEILSRHGEFDRAVAGIGRSVTAAVLSSRRAWYLQLDDGVAIELGRDAGRFPPAERLTRFVMYYDSVKARVGAVAIADMRYPNGFALVVKDRAAGRPLKETAGQRS